jgi:magnesium transporter
MSEQEIRLWEELEQAAESGDAAGVAVVLEAVPSGELGWVMSHLDAATQGGILALLEPEAAADVVYQLENVNAVAALEELPPADAAPILRELRSDHRADLVAELDEPVAEAVLEAMPPRDAAAVRALVEYRPHVAGGLMVTEYLAFASDLTVGDVVTELRDNVERYADFQVQYIYVVDRGGVLVGVLRLRDLLLARPSTPLAQLMIAEPASVRDTATLEELEDLFDERGFLGVPVVDRRGRLVGLVRRVEVEEALAERADSDYRKSLGIVGGEELRTMPVLLRSGRRLSWLSVNVALNVVAASIIVLYEDTLASVIALAAFLPIISDMSGCSGNQAVAVSMRELSLGLAQPRDALRVWGKELSVGLINGAALGLLLGVVAWVWKGNVFLGLVVGGALAVNTVVAVSIGGTVPLLLRRFGFDPALASGPILTTVTDMCGFFFALGFATVMLSRLVG